MKGLLIFYFHCYRDRDVQDYFRRRFKFGSMIFPANYMGNIGRDTRADNKHFSWKAKIPLVAVSTGNASREFRDSGRCSPNLNEMAELESRNSVSTSILACDHFVLSTDRKTDAVSHH
ncbi:hypothetical protein TrispH2_011072 [Trichoplax sp. H2]|nr:hypothetical protein TrispH2_011072 [Trichoplax sp. H2]|eukprot:RDD36870.1 hypothetical protein TrispH2_011072 [Trichoplax sp. H2]